MDYYFEKGFLLLLNEVGTRGIKSTYFLKRGNVEMIYHFFPSLCHFLIYIVKKFNNPCIPGRGKFIQFQEVIREPSTTSFLAYRLLYI